MSDDPKQRGKSEGPKIDRADRSQEPRGGGQGRGKSSDAHAARDERQQSKVYAFAGDGTHPAGEVNKLGKAGPGQSRVRPVGGGDEFVVPNSLIEGLDDEPDDGPVPDNSEGSETGA